MTGNGELTLVPGHTRGTIINADLVGDEALAWLERLPTSEGQAALTPIGHSLRRTVYRASLTLNDGTCNVLVKQHRHDPSRSALTNAMCSRRAAHAARAAHVLRETGFRTFEPVAALRSPASDGQQSSWLVLRPLQGVTLRERLQGASPGQRVALLRDTVHEVARLHNAKFCHGDLKPSNILVLTDAPANTPSLGFIDLDRTRRAQGWLSLCTASCKALDIRTLVAHLRCHCDVDQALLHELADLYFAARDFGPLRRKLWRTIVDFPHKAVTRTQRAKAKRLGQPVPTGQSRFRLLLRFFFGTHSSE